MSFITNILGLGQLKVAVVGAILAALLILVGGTAYKLKSLNSEVNRLTEENTELVNNNKMLAINIEVVNENMMLLADTSLANQVTAKNLIKERGEAQKAINTLAASTVADKQTISKLYSRLDDILKDSANDGTLSPALRETIRNIQNSRKP